MCKGGASVQERGGVGVKLYFRDKVIGSSGNARPPVHVSLDG